MSVRRASKPHFALQARTKRYHVIRLLSSSRPTFLDAPSAVSYGGCPPCMRALRCTLEWDIKARDELRYSCTHTRNQSERALPSRAKQEPPHARSHTRSRHPYRGPDEWATFAWVAKSVRNLVLRPIRQLGINGR